MNSETPSVFNSQMETATKTDAVRSAILILLSAKLPSLPQEQLERIWRLVYPGELPIQGEAGAGYYEELSEAQPVYDTSDKSAKHASMTEDRPMDLHDQIEAELLREPPAQPASSLEGLCITRLPAFRPVESELDGLFDE